MTKEVLENGAEKEGNEPLNPSRRNLLASGAAAIGSTFLPAGIQNAQAQSYPDKPQPIAPNSPPAGYNLSLIHI